MVQKPQFSERVFEFAFNAEYAQRHHAVLAACPYLPTQQDEKSLGFDVEFKIKKRGGAVTSIFLEHKIARRVDKRSASNAHFWDAVGGPYFAFPFDIDQYNLIRKLATRRVRDIYYCAPLFTTRADIDNNFLNNRISSRSVWIDVALAGSVADQSTHSIVCGSGGGAFRFSSEGARVARINPDELVSGRRHSDSVFGIHEVQSLYNNVYETIVDYWPQRINQGRAADHDESVQLAPREVPKRKKAEALSDAVVALSDLVSRYLGMSWLLLCRKQADAD
jgi:hypothetical protein